MQGEGYNRVIKSDQRITSTHKRKFQMLMVRNYFG